MHAKSPRLFEAIIIVYFQVPTVKGFCKVQFSLSTLAIKSNISVKRIVGNISNF